MAAGVEQSLGLGETQDNLGAKLREIVSRIPLLVEPGKIRLVGVAGNFGERIHVFGSRIVENDYAAQSRAKAKRALFDKLDEAHDFDLPPRMVDAEFDSIWQRIEADRAKGEQDEDDKGKDDETLKAEYRTIAERRVRLGLLLAEIGRANNITVGNDELTRAMRTEASRYPGQEQQVMEFFRKNPQAAETLRGPILEEKVVDFVLELAKVTDSVVPVEELTAAPPAAA